MEKEAHVPATPDRTRLMLGWIFLGVVNGLLITAIYLSFDLLESRQQPPDTIARGMTRDDVLFLNGPPQNTTRGRGGLPIDKFGLPRGRFLYVFYDTDSRVSSFFVRNFDD